MRLKLLAASFLLVLCSSCIKEAVMDHSSKYPLYYEALLTNYSSVQVHVSPIVSLQAASSGHAPRWIQDISIILYEDDIIVDSLIYFRNGVYRSQVDFIPQTGKSYHFVATHKDYPRTVSNKVVLDQEPEVTVQSFSPFRQGHRLQYNIKSVPDEAYYELRYLYRAESNLIFHPRNIEHLNMTIDFISDTGCAWDHSIVTNLCHSGLDIPLDMYTGMNNLSVTPDRLTLDLDRINEPLFSQERFFEFPTDAPEAFGFGVNIQTNLFEEGVGVFYTRVRRSFEFRF